MEYTLGPYYSTTGISKALSIYNFLEDYYSSQSRFISMAIRYICTHKRKSPYRCPSDPELLATCNVVFNRFLQNRYFEGIREIADITSTLLKDNTLLNRIGQLDIPDPDVEPREPRVEHREPRAEPRVVPRIIPEHKEYKDHKEKIKTVYGDSQNVHNSKINESVLKVAKYLYEKYKERFSLTGEIESNPDTQIRHDHDLLSYFCLSLKGRYPEKENLISHTETYMKNNTGNFGENITLLKVFVCICFWIDEHEHKAELEKRLLEELRAMKGFCTTGHLARIINIIQGFTSDENLCIRISERDQCASVVKQYLSSCLAKCQDEKVVEGITTGSREYVTFIRGCVSEKLLEWKREYGADSPDSPDILDILDTIREIVNSYAGTEVFRSNIKDGNRNGKGHKKS